jgi:hypothetical protein
MRIDLPSGNWVELRDKLLAIDRFAVQEVALVETGDKSKVSFLTLQNDMRNALLGRIITSWSYDAPIPSKNSFAAADVVIGNAMDLEDYAALEDAVEPFMELISGKSQPSPKKPETG